MQALHGLKQLYHLSQQLIICNLKHAVGVVHMPFKLVHVASKIICVVAENSTLPSPYFSIVILLGKTEREEERPVYDAGVCV